MIRGIWISLLSWLIVFQNVFESVNCKTLAEEENDCICGRQNKERTHIMFRVLGGTEVTSKYKYPWIVSIFEKGGFKCGGSLISPSFILTAAHCIVDNKQKVGKASDFTIGLLGVGGEPRQILPVKKVIPYPYNRQLEDMAYDDIALIQLERPIRCTSESSPICLPHRDISKVGLRIISAGQGIDDYDNPSDKRLLLEAKGIQVNSKECGDIFKPESIICMVGEDETTSCSGDSGSIVFAEIGGVFYAVGVTSTHTSYTCELDKPVVLMNVYTHLKWIKSEVKDLPRK